MIELDVNVEGGDWLTLGDVEELCRRAVETALTAAGWTRAASFDILLTDDAAVRILNREWRNLDKPTNVLSFPAGEQPDGPGVRHVGDIVLAYETTLREALDEGKTLADHAAHLVVHGVLHCLGYDHETDEDADAMEALEVEALGRIGIADPYRDEAA